MSHELELVGGQASMAYAGELPWHGLGKKVPADLSPEQIMNAANLNWRVEKRPLFRADGTEIKDFSILTRDRDGHEYDIVSKDWQPLQNEDAFKFFHEFVAAGDMEMHTAGSIKNGLYVWALAKVKDSFEVFGGDRVDSYLLLTNPHRYASSIDVRFTPVRVVCNNTLTEALGQTSAKSVRASHRSAFNADHVKQMLGISKARLAEYKKKAEFLGSRKASLPEIQKYLADLFPVIKNKEVVPGQMTKNGARVLSLLETQPGAKFAEGSWWQPFNAVTHFTDHIYGRNAENRVASMWYGSNKTLKEVALKKAIQYAEAA